METHFGFSIVFAAVKWTVRCVGYNSKLLRVEGMTMRHRVGRQRRSTLGRQKNFGLMIRTHLCYSKAADKCLAQGHIGENPCLSALFFVCLMCIEVFGQFHNFFCLGQKVFGNESSRQPGVWAVLSARALVFERLITVKFFKCNLLPTDSFQLHCIK